MNTTPSNSQRSGNYSSFAYTPEAIKEDAAKRASNGKEAALTNKDLAQTDTSESEQALASMDWNTNPSSYIAQMAINFLQPMQAQQAQLYHLIEQLLGFTALMNEINQVYDIIFTAIEEASVAQGGGEPMDNAKIQITSQQYDEVQKACDDLTDAGYIITNPFKYDSSTGKYYVPYSGAEAFLEQLTNYQSQLAHEMSTSMIAVTTSFQALQNSYKVLTNLMASLAKASASAMQNIG